MAAKAHELLARHGWRLSTSDALPSDGFLTSEPAGTLFLISQADDPDIWFLETDPDKARAFADAGLQVQPFEQETLPGDADAGNLLGASPVTEIGVWRDQMRVNEEGLGDQPGLRQVVDGVLRPLSQEPDSPTGRKNRILLLVHGTFSNSAQLLKNFAAPDHDGSCPGIQLLNHIEHQYRRVVAFTHFTRSVTPDENARMLADQLTALFDQLSRDNQWQGLPEIDIMAHSRGGLVARYLLERIPLEKADLPWRRQVRNLVMVATPNAGTNLAVPGNYGRLVGLLMRISDKYGWAADLADEFMSMLGTTLENQWSGVQCMLPGGAWLTEYLYSSKLKPEFPVNYFSVSGNFEPEGDLWHPFRLIWQLTKDVALDTLFRVANDLVVDTVSVTGRTHVPSERDQQVGEDLALREALVYREGPARDVDDMIASFGSRKISYYVTKTRGIDHSTYFRTGEFAQAVGRWLNLEGESERA